MTNVCEGIDIIFFQLQTQGRALRIDSRCSALAACAHKFILQLTYSAIFQGCRETIDTGWWNRLSVPVPVPVLVLTFPQRALWHKPRSRHLSLFPSRDGHHRSLYQNRPDEPFSAPSPGLFAHLQPLDVYRWVVKEKEN